VSGRRREIDADGAVVAPGFVDIHTHCDGQATWESRLQPSSWHGVTTVVMGNCGVGFAPVLPQHRDRLIELMEGIEDIPGTALHEGLPWNWQSFPEYLDALDARPYDVDVAAQVPHAALRVHAMGERAAAYADATGEEIALMARLAKEAVESGALGLATSRTLNHKSIAGELTPVYDVGAEELVAIATAVGETGRGVFQLVSDFPEPKADVALMRAMVSASGRPLSVSLLVFPLDPQRHREVLALLDEAHADGLPILAQVAARPIGMLLGLHNTVNPFMTNPVWCTIADLAADEQAARMAPPDFRAAVLGAQTRDKDRSRLGGNLIHKYELMYELTDPPNIERERGRGRIRYIFGHTDAEAGFLRFVRPQDGDAKGWSPLDVGWLLREGRFQRLDRTRSRMRNHRDPATGWSARMQVELTDVTGRTMEAEGFAVSHMCEHGAGSNALMRWDYDGKVGWGEDQDSWRPDHFRKMLSALRATTRP
jgi:N-acyl-D-aspartate/D-glutamate deacylase